MTAAIAAPVGINTLSITQADLQGAVLDGHRGNALFTTALESKNSPRELVKLVGRYVNFNGVFGGGVANLSGELAERRDLFYDPNEEVTSFADRSAHVAARIYAASVAEFGGEECHPTHRALAQATLKGMANYFNIPGSELNTMLNSSDVVRLGSELIQSGYGVNRTLNDRDLFFGIGFHMGSECLADQEFNILDEVLKRNWPELISYLQRHRVHIGTDHLNAYEWIGVHTTVEADHYAFSMQGANLALQYYQGVMTQEQAREAILSGFREFARQQTAFMQYLLEG